MEVLTTDDRWLIFELAQQRYAINVAMVRELTRDDQEPTRVPGQPDEVRGTINFRGTVVPVVDLRKRMGLESLAEDTQHILEQLEELKKAHVGWLAELDRAVKEDDEFHLPRNHHLCAFGKWYDVLVADEQKLEAFCNGSPNLISAIKKFDAPHRRIHATADEALGLCKQGDQEAALAVIDRTRDGALAEMVHLFDTVSKLLVELRQAIVVVLDRGQENVAIQVDRVDAVIAIEPSTIDDMPSMTTGCDMVDAVYKDKAGDLVTILDMSPLFSAAEEEATADPVSESNAEVSPETPADTAAEAGTEPAEPTATEASPQPEPEPEPLLPPEPTIEAVATTVETAAEDQCTLDAPLEELSEIAQGVEELAAEASEAAMNTPACEGCGYPQCDDPSCGLQTEADAPIADEELKEETAEIAEELPEPESQGEGTSDEIQGTPSVNDLLGNIDEHAPQDGVDPIVAEGLANALNEAIRNEEL